jgi:hypothetical protein
MEEPHLTADDIADAKRIWAEYQETHDLSDRTGKIAGIDPATGEVWLGEWFTDIAAERQSKGLTGPLFFERIGSPTALFKGGHHLERIDKRAWSAGHQY